MDTHIEKLKSDLSGLRQQVLEHPLYGSLKDLYDLRVYMSHHVFAVWDFMSLLKRLQRDLTCVDLPWQPKGSAKTRRFINDIVMGEECDEDGEGGYLSHFELYLKAMDECGADINRIQAFLKRLAKAPVPEALRLSEVPEPARHFVESTWATVEKAPIHAVAAAFALGREDLVPDLFRSLVANLHAKFPSKLKTFCFYLQRHIQLDENHHTPLALEMLKELCGNDERLWAEARQAAAEALQARLHFWNGISRSLKA